VLRVQPDMEQENTEGTEKESILCCLGGLLFRFRIPILECPAVSLFGVYAVRRSGRPSLTLPARTVRR